MLRTAFAVALIAALAPTPTTAAQTAGRFEGRLVDEGTGAVIAGAAVSVAGATGTVTSDKDGRFTWEPAPAVPFHLIVVLPGGQLAKPIVVEALPEGPMEIRVSSLAQESITVLGAAPSIDTAPASATTLLSATQIAQRTPENLMQALETVPGVHKVSEGHAAVPAVRGMARGRTLFLIDGGRVTAERRVGPSASFLDPSVIEAVDVSRGPGSVAYGSDALGGVISVRTRRAEPGSPLRVRFTGTVGAGVPEQRGAVEVAKGLPRGGLLVQAHIRNSEDYASPRGTVFNSGWEDQGFLVNFTHAIGGGFLSSAWQSDFARDVERPRSNSRSVRFFNPFENSHRLTASYELPEVGDFRQLSFTGFFGTTDLRTDQDRFATATAGRSLERADIAARDFHAKASADRTLGRARIEFGVDLNGRFGLEALDITETYDLGGVLTAATSNVSIEDAHRLNVGVFVQTDAALGSIATISGGIRGDRVTTTNTGGYFGDRTTVNAAAAGFGSITLLPFDGFSLSAQLSRGFRDPSLSDRYFRGPSGRGFITGNPDLGPETSLQVDLAARYTRRRGQLAVYFYEYRIHDLIERYETDSDFFFFRNRGRARLRGFELETRADLGGGFTLDAGGQIARGAALDDEANLDDVSADSFWLVGRKQFTTNLYAQARVAVSADDDQPGPTEVESPGSTVVDAGGGWRLSSRFELRAMVRNLFDEEYFASPDPRWVYAPGRSGSLTLIVQF